jgi:predicted PP-loop superfamily ATPase
MAGYENLTFNDLSELLVMKNEKTSRMNKLKDIIEVNLDDVRKKVYQNGGTGELIIKIKMKQEGRDMVATTADVTTKLPKAKNELKLYQNEKAEIFLDQPNQQVLAGVLGGGTSSNREKA